MSRPPFPHLNGIEKENPVEFKEISERTFTKLAEENNDKWRQMTKWRIDIDKQVQEIQQDLASSAHHDSVNQSLQQ